MTNRQAFPERPSNDSRLLDVSAEFTPTNVDNQPKGKKVVQQSDQKRFRANQSETNGLNLFVPDDLEKGSQHHPTAPHKNEDLCGPGIAERVIQSADFDAV